MPGGWTRVAEVYAETFAGLCAGAHPALLDAVGVAAGTRVLDVGSGTGLLAAAALARGAAVTAVDPDEEMLALTRAAAPAARVLRGGLPDLPGPLEQEPYAAVLAAFVVNHLPDPAAGVAALARATAPGGRLAMSTWPSGATPQSLLWQRVVADAGAVEPPGVRLAPELDFDRTPDGLAGLVAGTGLEVVSARTVQWTHVCDPDMVWRGAAAGIGGQGATLAAQPEDVRVRMRQAYRRHVADLVVGGRLRLDTTAVLVAASRPGPGR